MAQDNNTTAVGCQVLYSFFSLSLTEQSTKLTRIQFAQTIHNSRKEAIVTTRAGRAFPTRIDTRPHHQAPATTKTTTAPPPSSAAQASFILL